LDPFSEELKKNVWWLSSLFFEASLAKEKNNMELDSESGEESEKASVTHISLFYKAFLQ